MVRQHGILAGAGGEVAVGEGIGVLVAGATDGGTAELHGAAIVGMVVGIGGFEGVVAVAVVIDKHAEDTAVGHIHGIAGILQGRILRQIHIHLHPETRRIKVRITDLVVLAGGEEDK